MQVINIGRATFKLSEFSGTLAKLQKCIDSQKKKTKRPAIKKDAARKYPPLYLVSTTEDYVRMYYEMNQAQFFPHSRNRAEQIKTLFPDFFQPMLNRPFPTV